VAKFEHQGIRIKVPASTTNLGPGYDCLGLALKLYNYFEFERLPRGKTQIIWQGEQSNGMRAQVEKLVLRAAQKAFDLCGVRLPRLRITLKLNIPIARGLGSSATAIIASMVAANELCGNRIPVELLLVEIAKFEGHPDNVTACFLGGLTASVFSRDGLAVKKYRPSGWLKVVVVVPSYRLETRKAREVIPKNVTHRDAVLNLSRVPLVIDRLVTGNLSDLRVLMDDRLHQPYRKPLIKGYDRIVKAGLDAGASAVVLSGAGPSMVAFCTCNVEQVATDMGKILNALNISNYVLILSPDNQGTIVERF
jgi:homoserine kinase